MKKILTMIFALSSLTCFAESHQNGIVVNPNETKIEFEYVDGAFYRNTINMKIGGLIVRALVGRVIEVARINGDLYRDYSEGTTEANELEDIYESFKSKVLLAQEENKLIRINPHNEASMRIQIID